MTKNTFSRKDKEDLFLYIFKNKNFDLNFMALLNFFIDDRSAISQKILVFINLKDFQ